ncbi:hypothetical protein TNCV_1525741 [Trichonephila clavipes]|nr:hypothetical protein TNCV_1525741 [Trichonephila clavipes]
MQPPLALLTKGRTDLTEFSDSVLKAIASETINTRYSQPDWLHVYTDGSRLDRDGSEGVGIISELFAFYLNLNLGSNTTPFECEVETIRTTIKQLLFRKEPFENVVTFSDAVSSVQDVTSLNISDTIRIRNCIENLGLLFLP